MANGGCHDNGNVTCRSRPSLAGDFQGRTSLSNALTTTIPFDGLGTELLFYAQGTGEASTVAAMDFVPAKLPSKPVDRGFQIQKVWSPVF